jgi:hypothetical protein
MKKFKVHFEYWSSVNEERRNEREVLILQDSAPKAFSRRIHSKNQMNASEIFKS